MSTHTSNERKRSESEITCMSTLTCNERKRLEKEITQMSTYTCKERKRLEKEITCMSMRDNVCALTLSLSVSLYERHCVCMESRHSMNETKDKRCGETVCVW